MKELIIKDSSNIDNNNYRENKPVIYQNSGCYTVEHVSNMCRTCAEHDRIFNHAWLQLLGQLGFSGIFI